MERRIASLSGSTAASDIAEKRKLQAELNDAKASLDDEYISHSRTAQDDALDAESEAYTLSKEKYIEQLEEQLEDTQTLIENSIMDVLLNADTVYTELNNLADIYGVDLSDSLTQPWKAASDQAIAWKDELARTLSASELALITHENGAVTAFSNGVATKLTGTWTKVQTKVKDYSDYLTSSELSSGFSRTLTGFGNQIQKIIDKWNGVKTAADAAYDASTRQVTVGGNVSYSSGSGSGNSSSSDNGKGAIQTTKKKYYASAYLDMGSRSLSVTKSGDTEAAARTAAQIAILGEYEKLKGNSIVAESAWQRVWRNKVKYTIKQYAKGTSGVSDDQLAIVDELGPELILRANPTTGRLDYITMGTGIVPADLTENLMKWGKLNPNMMSMPDTTPNISMINNAVTKPQYDFSFDSLVHVDNCDQSTLKDLEKMVDNKIDKFSKDLNYSLKKFAR